MKVLVVHTKYKVKGGEEVIVENETELLRENGVEVKNLFFENKEGMLNSVLQFLQLPFNVGSYLKVKKEIKDFHPNIIHLHNWNYAGSPSIITAAINSKVPIILSIHNYRLLCPSGTLFYDGHLFLKSLEESFPWSAIRKAVYRNSYLQTFLLAFTIYIHKKLGTWKSVRFYIVNTISKKQLFLKSGLGFLNKQIVVKPNSSPDISYNFFDRSNDFIYVGRLNVEKGLLILLEAFKNSNFSLIIIGDGPLKSLVEKTSVTHQNIKYKGRLSHDQTLIEIEKASTLVFPSIWFEGMPMTIVEAFSTGTPVISSFIGAMENMIRHEYNGLHVKPGSVEDLLDKLQFWSLLSEDKKLDFRKNARSTYELTYTPLKNLQELVSLYASTINS